MDATAEVLEFKKIGGRTIVDQTTRGLGSDQEAVRAVERLTALNVVIGTGYYVNAATMLAALIERVELRPDGMRLWFRVAILASVPELPAIR
jgi:predicted metal-dependent phosphotriesterase family hydrolase